MAKAKKVDTDIQDAPEEQQLPETAEPQSTIQPYEEWEVKVESKKRMDPETFEVETYHTFEKKGDKPVRVTHIEERHAEVLNSQVNNTKKYFYPKG